MRYISKVADMRTLTMLSPLDSLYELGMEERISQSLRKLKFRALQMLRQGAGGLEKFL